MPATNAEKQKRQGLRKTTLGVSLETVRVVYRIPQKTPYLLTLREREREGKKKNRLTRLIRKQQVANAGLSFRLNCLKCFTPWINRFMHFMHISHHLLKCKPHSDKIYGATGKKRHQGVKLVGSKCRPISIADAYADTWIEYR